MNRILKRVAIAITLLFLYAPIFVLIAFSFNKSKSRTVWEGFTLDWYPQLIQDSLIMNSLYTTLTVAVIASLSATIIGTIASVGIHNLGGVPKTLMLSLNQLPVLNPDIITGISFMLLFGFVNMPAGMATLILAHITFNIPYVILSVSPKLRQLNPHLYEAALDLGASPAQGFFKVVMPQIMPGIVTGLLLAFTLSIDDFVISYFTSGTTSQTLAVTIYSMTKRRVSPKINALSTLMFVFVLVMLIIINLRQIHEEKKKMLAERQATRG